VEKFYCLVKIIRVEDFVGLVCWRNLIRLLKFKRVKRRNNMSDFFRDLARLRSNINDICSDIDIIILKKQKEKIESEKQEKNNNDKKDKKEEQSVSFKSMTNISMFISNNDKDKDKNKQKDADIIHIEKAIEKGMVIGR
jgi:hypothetical protein